MQDTTKMPVRLSEDDISLEFKTVDSAWILSDDKKNLIKKFEFKGFNKTMAFVNAVAWIAGRTMHHPDMSITFNTCTIHYTTHDAGGITQNDFMCARQIDQL